MALPFIKKSGSRLDSWSETGLLITNQDLTPFYSMPLEIQSVSLICYPELYCNYPFGNKRSDDVETVENIQPGNVHAYTGQSDHHGFGCCRRIRPGIQTTVRAGGLYASGLVYVRVLYCTGKESGLRFRTGAGFRPGFGWQDNMVDR